MKKFSLFFILTFLFATSLYAVPARKNTRINVTLEDGTMVELSLMGDEYAHWWEDSEGKAYDVSDEGFAVAKSDESLIELRSRGNSLKAERNAARQKRIPLLANDKAKYTGTKRGLVILVNFADLDMQSSTAQEDYDCMFNEEGYSENSHIGSVADYFRDQSYGEFNIEFDVVGPVTVSQPYAYYGQNKSNGDDSHPCELVIETCNLVDSEVDFSTYDWDGNGEVNQVFIVYAGHGENSGASSNTIWPHEWTLAKGARNGDGTGPVTLDGVTVDTYAMTCELRGRTSTIYDGIGTACHEFSHCLGFPDFYDTSYSGGWGMEEWDLLDAGGYNGPDDYGEVPVGYTAYERWVAGWLEPTTLSAGMKITGMQPLNSVPEAYILYNEGNSNEYYLLENRLSDRWFSYVLSYSAPSGMLITHVDYDQTAWDNNTPNKDADHQRMTMFLANNEKGTLRSGIYNISRAQYLGHLYPYEENDSLSAYSTPAATLYNASTDGTYFMNKGIYFITYNSDGTMDFQCLRQASDGNDPNSENVIFYESFDYCDGQGGNDGKWSGNLSYSDFLTDNAGWVSDNAFVAYKCAKVGNTGFAGDITSPAITIDGEAVLSFKLGIWNTTSEAESVQIWMNENFLVDCVAPKGDWEDFSYTIDGKGRTAFLFQGAGRFFLDEVKVVKPESTGIKEINYSYPTKEGIYNLSGQYVGTSLPSLPRGIYIKDGHKIVKK